MRKRQNRLWVHLSDDEFTTVKTNVQKSGLSKETYIRCVLLGHVPREKPDEQFYVMMKDLTELANNAKRLASLSGKIDSDIAWEVHLEAEKWSRFQLDVRKAFLLPEKI